MDSTIPDNLLEIDGYNLVRAEHPSIVERGGVCICHKDSLSVGIINLHYYIKKALLLEVAYNNKKVIVPVIYRSTSQNSGLIFYLILVT